MDANYTLGLLAQSTRSAAQGPDLTRYLLVCVLLLLALGLLAFGFKKLVAGAVRARADKRSLQVLDLIAPVEPSGAQVPFLDAGVAAIQLGSGSGGVGTEAIDEARLGAIGSAIGTLLVRLDAEPRPAPPSGAYIAVSGRVIPGKAIALLAIALLIGPLFAVGRRLVNGGAPSRAGWSAALTVAVVGAVCAER